VGVLDCQHVLTSRWSKWWGMPVALPAIPYYLGLLFALTFVGPLTPAAVRRKAWALVWLATFAAACAAVWFIALQLLVLKKFCLFCLLIHCLNLLLVIVAIRANPFRRAATVLLAGAGIGLFLFIVAGQVFVQDRPTYEIAKPHHHGSAFLLSDMSADEFSRSNSARWLCDQSIGIDLGQTPHLGDPDATGLVALMFDYTCPHCRKMRRQLGEVLRSRSAPFCVAVVVVPLNPECNKYLDSYDPAAEDACALARLSLAVWQQRPDAFAAYDAWLMDGRHAPPVDVARARGAAIIGRELLDGALADPALSAQLERHTALYENLHRGLLPKLLLPDAHVVGELRSTTEMMDVLKKHHQDF
jgi:uncharacterized membrane protein